MPIPLLLIEKGERSMTDDQDKLDPDIEALIEETLEEVPQQLLGERTIRLVQLEQLLAAIQGPAMRMVIEARVDQIVKRGHTRDSDAMLPIGWLSRRAHDMVQAATDNIDGTLERRNLPIAKARLARAAALCLAAIDRLNMIKEEPSA